MVKSIFGKSQKITRNIKVISLIVLLIIYPFGQLLRIDNFLGFSGVNLLLIDVICGLSFLFLPACFDTFKRYFGKLFLYMIFVNFLSISILPIGTVLFGSTYILRLFSYCVLYVVVRESVKGETEKNKLIQLLFYSILTLSISGWVQYFIFPDLREFRNLMWDDHLYRMTSTLLDPNYFGAVVLIGISISYYLYKINKSKIYIFFIIFFLLTLLLSYSRASYVSFFVMVLYLGTKNRNFKKYVLLILVFIGFIFLLPRYSSEGAKLERLHSVFQRINDYKQTLSIVGADPLFGVGYSNLCAIRDEMGISRSCSGSSSSILYILATTGVVGLIIFAQLAINIYQNITTSSKLYVELMFIGVIVHSFFNNSMFYPFIIVIFMLFIGANAQNTTVKKQLSG